MNPNAKVQQSCARTVSPKASDIGFEKEPAPTAEAVTAIPLSALFPFPDHPFSVKDDEAMQETVESVREFGVIVPILVRPRENGGYEIVSGHRRRHAAELAGLESIPAIVRDIDRDAATILLVDSNLQRPDIPPSERAKAYKMKLTNYSRDGIARVNSGLKELEREGYLVRSRTRNARGRFDDVVYQVYEFPVPPEQRLPQTENPIVDSPIAETPKQENPRTENPTLLNTVLPSTERSKAEPSVWRSIRPK